MAGPVQIGFLLIKLNYKQISLRHLVKRIFITALIHQRLELSILDLEELTRLSEFYDVSGIKDHLYEFVSDRKASWMTPNRLTILSASMMVCNL